MRGADLRSFGGRGDGVRWPRAGRPAITSATAVGAGLAAGWLRASRRERECLKALREMARASSARPDARKEVCEAGRRLLGADADALMVHSDGDLVLDTCSGIDLPDVRVSVEEPESIVARAYRDQEVLFATGASSPELGVLGQQAGATAVLVAPITRMGLRTGVNLWVWRQSKRRLWGRERRLASIVGDEKGVSIQRKEMFVQSLELMRNQVRVRLARDLHDSIAQELALVRVYGDTLSRALDEDPDAATEMLAQMKVRVAKAEQEMRELLDALRAGRPLVELGVVDLIDALTADFRKRCGDVEVAVDLTAQEDRLDLHPSVRETVYFVLREALHNAARHAGAGRISVVARTEDDHLLLQVQDNGRGFDLHEMHTGRHGLTGMRERAELIGGELEVRSSPGAGTSVRLRVALRFEAPESVAG